ncbi:armadillo-type protein [Mycena rosella]|uniref:Vacuolar protein 8 n=1 Tax=Mycena rosella TaxID=1033263 RepID=A0AAD7DH28_MYCRO|nr:armadillo-type protein [Mycena rosella]
MHPSHRPQSLHSRWSDSNSLGPTIPLHSLAKPLSKVLHRRQVSGIISQERSLPLSSDVLDCLLGYLESKEISTATKLLILHDLNVRARLRTEARTIVQENAFPVIIRLLDSPKIRIVDATCTLLGTFPLSQEILDILMWSLGDGEIPTTVKLLILKDLNIRATWEAQARNMAQENVLVVVIGLLHSKERNIVESVCSLLGNLASWKSVNAAIVMLNPCQRLVSLASLSVDVLPKQSIYALSCISKWKEGARAIADANPEDLAAKLLPSEDLEVLEWTCHMLGQVAQFGRRSGRGRIYTDTVPLKNTGVRIALGSAVYVRLNSLIDHPERAVQKEALYALNCIREGTEPTERIASGASTETLVNEIFNESSVESTRYSKLTSVLKHADPSFLLSVLNSANPVLVRVAITEIEHISESEPGATALSNSNLLCNVVELLDLEHPSILESSCRILANTAQSADLRETVVDLFPYCKLVLLLRHTNISVQHLAIYSLHQIYYYQAEFSATGVLAKLLDSPDLHVVQSCFHMLGNLAQNTNLHGSILESGCCVPLVSLFYRPDVPVKEPLQICLSISQSEIGAFALVDANILEQLIQLLDFGIAFIVESACRILGNIARWPSLRAAVVQLDLCPQLKLLVSCPQDGGVEEAANYALHTITGASLSGPHVLGVVSEQATPERSPDSWLHHYFDDWQTM